MPVSTRQAYGSLATAIIALTIAPLGAAAHADPIGPEVAHGDDIAVSVSVADLNLRTEAGARAAIRRLTVAAREVCSPEPGVTELVRWQRYESCVKAKVAKGAEDLGAPLVVALARHAPHPSSLAEARP